MGHEAEVTMTFGSNGQSFPGAYSELSEVSISRKVVCEGDQNTISHGFPAGFLGC